MKTLNNNNRTVFGIKHDLFTILKDTRTSNYIYYLNSLGSSKNGDCMIYKGGQKSLLLNKYVLCFLGFFYTIFNYTLKWPLAILVVPFIMYFRGAKNYITNSAWVNHVRFFNNVNIFIMVTLILILMYIK